MHENTDRYINSVEFSDINNNGRPGSYRHFIVLNFSTKHKYANRS